MHLTCTSELTLVGLTLVGALGAVNPRLIVWLYMTLFFFG